MAARTKAARKTAAKAGHAAAQARTNPYVQRFIEDEELRASVLSAYESHLSEITPRTVGTAMPSISLARAPNGRIPPTLKLNSWSSGNAAIARRERRR